MEREANSIRDHRFDARMTCKEVAEKAGISKAYYTQLEHGNRKLTVEAAAKLEPVLGVSWETLIKESRPELFGNK